MAPETIPSPGDGDPARTQAGRRTRRSVRRSNIALVGLVLAAASLAGLWLTGRGGETYVLNARFQNAGQLVKGGLVQVGGNTIGKIAAIDLVGGQANVRLAITDHRFQPLHEGTRASIRAVGQATITNRYVDIGPGPDNRPEIADGAILPTSRTAGIVDLDEILNAADSRTRRNLQGLIGNATKIYAGSGAPEFNRMLGKLEPALAQVGGLVGDLADDREQLRQLIASGAVATRALAARPDDLESAVSATADTMGALASDRNALTSALERTPAVLAQAAGTLEHTARTANDLRPMLRAVPGPQPGLRRVLARLPTALATAQKPFGKADALLPPLRTALARVPGLERPAVDALQATGTSMKEGRSILEGLRYYGPDLILGVVNGLTGIASGGYDSMGHYLKFEFVQSGQTLLGGGLAPLVPLLTKDTGLLPNVLNTSSGLFSRCPGSNAPPAPDGSNPWYPKTGICDPTQSMSGLVNSPTATCRTQSDCQGDTRSLKPEPDPGYQERPKKKGGAR